MRRIHSFFPARTLRMTGGVVGTLALCAAGAFGPAGSVRANTLESLIGGAMPMGAPADTTEIPALGQARELAAAGRRDEAVARYSELLAERPYIFSAWKELGALQEAMSAPAQAARVYASAVEYFPDRRELYVLVGRTEARAGNTAGARSWLHRARHRWPEDSEVLRMLGESYLSDGAYQQAEHYLRQSLHHDPSDGAAAMGLAELYLARGRFEDARKLLESMPQASVFEERWYSLWAHYYGAREQWAAQAQMLEALLLLNPQEDEIRWQLAGAYANQEQWTAATRILAAIRTPRLQLRAQLATVSLYVVAGDGRSLQAFLALRPRLMWILGGIFFLTVSGGALLVGIPLAVAWVASRHRRRDIDVYAHVRWGWGDLVVILAALLVLPILCGMAAARWLQGNWFAVLGLAGTLTSPAVYSALLGQQIAMGLVVLMIFWRLRKRYGQAWRDMGLRKVPLGSGMRQAAVAMLWLMVFSIAYQQLFSAMTGAHPQPQIIRRIIDASREHPGLVFLWIHVVVLGPLAEELIFRGFLFSGLRRRVHFQWAACLSAVLFAALHFHGALFVPIAFMGWVFAWLFERSRSIWPALAVHVLWNLLGVSVTLGAGL